MSEEEPLKGQQEQKISNQKSDRITTIDRSDLHPEGQWQREVKIARSWSLCLYITLMALYILGTLSIILFMMPLSTSWITQWKKNSWINKITYAILMSMAILMVFYGLISMFRYGGTTVLEQRLKSLNIAIKAQAKQLQIQTNSLQKAVSILEQKTAKAKERENNLRDIAELGSELRRLGTKIDVDNNDIQILFNQVDQKLLETVSGIKRDIVKNEMLVKFYKYEMNDDRDGLSKKEYELFIKSLDKQTADTWNHIGLNWRNLKGNNNIIDVEEFKDALNKLVVALDEVDDKIVKHFNKREKGVF